MIPNISKVIVNRKIVAVISSFTEDFGDRKGDGNTSNECYTPTGDIYIKLDNGCILKCWNSEWGGISVLTPKHKGHEGREYTEIDKAMPQKVGKIGG